MKKASLSIYHTNILKIFAVLIVVVSHWYRFYDSDSHFAFLKSTGVFGASLFAFLSGFGVEKSYKKKGFGEKWLYKRILRVYIPFFIINIISLLIYKPRGQINIILHIIFGKNDGVMWYVPFIIVFYIVFFVLNKITYINTILVMCLIALVYISVCFVFNIQSQWYTSVGALVLGVYFASTEKKITSYGLVLSMLICGLSCLLSKKVEVQTVTDIFTIISSTAFCWFVYLAFSAITINLKYKFVNILGGATYWLYLIHMKILFLWENTYVMVFLAFCFIISVTLYVSYNKIEKALLLIRKKTD